MQPTPARSPSLNFVTSSPTAHHAADDLVPRHARVDRVAPIRSRTLCRSEWQTPQ